MWRLIGITIPEHDNVQAEKERIISLLDSGYITYFHVRKPGFSYERMRQWLSLFGEEYRARMSLHDHHELAKTMNVGGIHLNGRNKFPPLDANGLRLSCSCHSIHQIEEEKKGMDYLFLSPVFDSISKKGYRAGFTKEELMEASRKGIIDDKVVALSGVSEDKFEELKAVGFTSAALLGSLWN